MGFDESPKLGNKIEFGNENKSIERNAKRELAELYISDILERERYINFSEQRKWEALKCNPEKYPFAIRHIHEPTDEMYEFAINVNVNNIKYVPKNRQTHNLCALALKKNWLVIGDIWNQTEELQLLAVQQNPWSIFEMENPSLSTFHLAVWFGWEEILKELVKRGNVEEGSKFYMELREEAFHHDDVYSV